MNQPQNLTRRLQTSELTGDDAITLANMGVNPVPTEKRHRWLKMATDDIDRAGDQLLIRGMDATNFLKNPQFLWQHGMSGALINTIGTIRQLLPTEHALYALAEYASEEISPLAEQVYRMDVNGYLPANSIGFRPIEYEENDFGGYTFTKWELIECSKVELPMNPQAIDDGEPRKAMSIEDVSEWLAQ